MTEHKHAAVLRAIADKGLGAAQWQDGKSLMGQWNDCTFMITPITHSFLAWRIKPEPKPDVVRYLNIIGYSDSSKQPDGGGITLNPPSPFLSKCWCEYHDSSATAKIS